MKKLLLAAAGLLAAFSLITPNAQAQFFLRGDFNSWGMTPLVDNGDGTFSATITGTPGAGIQYKIANADWSSSFPSQNVWSVFDAAGSFTATFIPTPAADGWGPSGTSRVGYKDPGQFGWEVMGSFNAWGSPVTSLTTSGNGLYSGTYTVATPGSYELKFRKAGDWNIAIGSDFGSWSGNITFATTVADEAVLFQLDLPNGRWLVSEVPEPSTLATLTCALAGLCWLRRRR